MSITDELRKWGYGFCGDTHDVVTAIADRIDAEHDKALNSVDDAYDSGYNVGYDEGFASADDWLAQHEDAMAEHGWVRKDKEHIISHATIEVTPHIDWSRMADELNEFVEIVRGMLIVGHSSTRTNGLKLRRTQMQFTDEQQRFIDEHYQLLPKDADGEYIHIGDKLIDEDDKLQKPAIVKCILYNDEGCVVSDIDPRGCWYNPSILRHYHAPTVEDVLREFAYGLGVPVADSYIAASAAKLRLAEEEDA